MSCSASRDWRNDCGKSDDGGALLPHGDPHAHAAEAADDRLPQRLPVGLAVGEQDGLGAARDQQASDALVAGGDAHRLEERVDADAAATAFDEHDAVRALQVVAESSGTGERALLLGAVEQLVDEVAAYAQLGLGEAADPGELHREDRGAVLERHDVVLARGPRRGRPG